MWKNKIKQKKKKKTACLIKNMFLPQIMKLQNPRQNYKPISKNLLKPTFLCVFCPNSRLASMDYIN